MSKGDRRPIGSADNIQEKENKYRKINEKLELKTNQLLKEADEILVQSAKANEDTTSHLSIDDKSEDFHNSNEDHLSTDTPYFHECCSDNVKPQVHDAVSKSTTVGNDDDEILLGPTCSLGQQAQNRYLKAKVRVLLEENQKLKSEFISLNDEKTRLKNRLQEVEEDRNRLHRVTTSHSAQLEKVKKSLQEARAQCDTLESEKNSFRKENDVTKRTMDQQTAETKTLTTRLNRALEDSEKLKCELEKLRGTSREQSNSMRHDIDQLNADNKRLEKQKVELVAIFKKQMKLIDVLRRQKMLIEASKCLQITEADFLKCLNPKNV